MTERGEEQWKSFYSVSDDRIRENLANGLDKIEDALILSVNDSCNIKLIAKIRKIYLDLVRALR